jgi:hypothetical protein
MRSLHTHTRTCAHTARDAYIADSAKTYAVNIRKRAFTNVNALPRGTFEVLGGSPRFSEVLHTTCILLLI